MEKEPGGKRLLGVRSGKVAPWQDWLPGGGVQGSETQGGWPPLQGRGAVPESRQMCCLFSVSVFPLLGAQRRCSDEKEAAQAM